MLASVICGHSSRLAGRTSRGAAVLHLSAETLVLRIGLRLEAVTPLLPFPYLPRVSRASMAARVVRRRGALAAAGGVATGTGGLAMEMEEGTRGPGRLHQGIGVPQARIFRK